MTIFGARSTGFVMTGTPSHIGSSSVMCADTGTKPSFKFTQQNAASIAPASDSPWPVRLLVELTSGRRPSGNTLLMALISDTSPKGVEVACALMYSICSGGTLASPSAIVIARESPSPPGSGARTL